MVRSKGAQFASPCSEVLEQCEGLLRLGKHLARLSRRGRVNCHVSAGAEERTLNVACNTKIEDVHQSGTWTAEQDLCGIGLSFKSKGGLQQVFAIKEGSMCQKLDIQEGDTLVQVSDFSTSIFIPIPVFHIHVHLSIPGSIHS